MITLVVSDSNGSRLRRLPLKFISLMLLTLALNGQGQIVAGSGGVLGKTNLSSFMGTDGVLLQLPTPPQPGIAIGLTNTDQVLVTITNAVSYANYELYRRTLLDTAHPWALRIVGTQGQSNFVTDMGVDLSFFVVGVGSDWDSDGIPNSQDGDPLDSGTGILVVTIDSPAQGAVITQ